VLDRDILSLDPAKLAQTLPQSVCPVRDRISAGALSYKTDSEKFLRLLRFHWKDNSQEQSAESKARDFFTHGFSLLLLPGSLDYLPCPHQHHWWNRQAKSLGGLQIDD
jgi:hypothetical protein